MYNIRVIVIQTGHNSRKGDYIVSYTRNVCRQDNYTLPFKSFCGTPRCNKDILDDSWQILYTRPYALFAFLHKGIVMYANSLERTKPLHSNYKQE